MQQTHEQDGVSMVGITTRTWGDDDNAPTERVCHVLSVERFELESSRDTPVVEVSAYRLRNSIKS